MKGEEDDLQEASYMYANALDENLIQINIVFSFSGISSGQHFKQKKIICPFDRNIITFICETGSAQCFQ